MKNYNKKIFFGFCCLCMTSLTFGKTITLSSFPSLMCNKSEVKKLLLNKLGIDVKKITVSERAGHVDYYDLSVDEKDKPKEKLISKLMDLRCMHVSNKTNGFIVVSSKCPHAKLKQLVSQYADLKQITKMHVNKEKYFHIDLSERVNAKLLDLLSDKLQKICN